MARRVPREVTRAKRVLDEVEALAAKLGYPNYAVEPLERLRADLASVREALSESLSAEQRQLNERYAAEIRKEAEQFRTQLRAVVDDVPRTVDESGAPIDTDGSGGLEMPTWAWWGLGALAASAAVYGGYRAFKLLYKGT